jgi:hypothetical protein
VGVTASNSQVATPEICTVTLAPLEEAAFVETPRIGNLFGKPVAIGYSATDVGVEPLK